MPRLTGAAAVSTGARRRCGDERSLGTSLGCGRAIVLSGMASPHLRNEDERQRRRSMWLVQTGNRRLGELASARCLVAGVPCRGQSAFDRPAMF